jgi:Sec7-like guanine-nucleotide exchange factor
MYIHVHTYIGSFRLPGEAQCIDRLMESFAAKLFKDLGINNPFASADAAYILAFSTIMLNTDLHNPQIPSSKRMTKEQFIRNNKGINESKDLPLVYLESLYEDIKNNQIKMDFDLNDSAEGFILDFTDSNLWNKMLRKSTADQVCVCIFRHVCVCI